MSVPVIAPCSKDDSAPSRGYTRPPYAPLKRRGTAAAPHDAEVFMKKVSLLFSMMLMIAAPLFAQSEHGYIAGAGGFAITPQTTSGDALVEGGVRVAPHLMLFGDLGQYHNVQPSDVQPAIDSTVAMLSSSQGLTTIGDGRVPATYALG